MNSDDALLTIHHDDELHRLHAPSHAYGRKRPHARQTFKKKMYNDKQNEQ